MPTIPTQVQAPAVATSMIGSLYGAVRTWDDTLTLTDLFGYSGHAFILNIERELCPSGPTAWDWGAILFPLRQMIGLRRVCASCDVRSPEEARELIWERAKAGIDAGRPAILWDLLLPEFYLAQGYDDECGEFLVSGPGVKGGAGRVPRLALGRTTGQIWALFPSPHESPDRAAARDLALSGAISWHRWPNERDAQWVFGGDAWDVWIEAMNKEELAHASTALSYNQFVYTECRRHAADFLAGQGEAFCAAANAYSRVADALEAVCAAWPYPAPAPALKVRRELAGLLLTARDAEEEAISALEAAL